MKRSEEQGFHVSTRFMFLLSSIQVNDLIIFGGVREIMEISSAPSNV